MGAYNKKLNIIITNQCSKDWSEIQANKNFCNSCSKHVYDLSKLTRLQTKYLFLKNSGKVCVKITRDENNDIIYKKKSINLRKFQNIFAIFFSYFTSIIALENQAIAENDVHNCCHNECSNSIKQCSSNEKINTNNSEETEKQIKFVLSPYSQTSGYWDRPTGTFGEAKMDNELVRNSINNLFMFIEGPVGLTLIILAAILTPTAIIFELNSIAMGMLTLSSLLIFARLIVKYFFAVELSDFE